MMVAPVAPEAAEGMLSLPAAFGTAFFFRFFVPGLLVSLASVPLWPQSWTTHLDLFTLATYLLGAFGLAIIIRGCYPLQTNALLGVGWPRACRDWAISRLQRRLALAQKIVKEPVPSAYSPLHPLWWDKAQAAGFIKMVPHIRLPGSEPVLQAIVVAPTLWGNLATAFAWDMERRFAGAPPTWLACSINPWTWGFFTMSSGTRRELYELMAYGEAALSASLGLGVLAFVYALAAIRGGWAHGAHGLAGYLVMAAVCSAAAYLTYKISVSEFNGTLDAARVIVLKEEPQSTRTP